MTVAPHSPEDADLAPADVLLADGSVAVIRPLRDGDRDGLRALHDEASDDSFRLRFFATGRKAGRDYVDHLFTDGTVACLVVTVHDRIVAVATAEQTAPAVAEVAFLVADPLRGHGVGSLLLEHLAAVGRDRGIQRFEAEVLSENQPMTRVFLDAGFEVTRSTAEGVVHVEMATAASSRAIAAADQRERRAEARSLGPLLSPRCVAVVGVRHTATGVGAAVLDSIRKGGFTGGLYVVHPHARDIDGVAAFPRLADIPEHVDLAVVAVPADRALGVLEDAVAAGVPTLAVISSGFEEVGPEGARIQREMVRVARDNSIRLVGPNCLGVMVNDPDLRLNATFTRVVPPPGGLAIASQSGGVGIALLDVAGKAGLGVQSFVSLGNKADVSGNDLLAAWLEDARVTAGALYLESFGNASKFARVARTFSERKPLLAVVGGRSSGGKRAGASHTAAAAAPAVGIDAVFAQAGVIGCSSAEAMAETALLLAGQPLPAGPRVAIVSNAGGIGVLAADAADGCGLVVPELSPGLKARVQEHLAGTAGTSNPVDLGAGAPPMALAATVEELLSSNEADALLVALVATSVSEPAPLLEALATARARHPTKPVVLVPLGGLGPVPGALGAVTVLGSVDAAVQAMARVARYADWLRVPREEPAPYDLDRATSARRLARELLAQASEDSDGWLPPARVAELLSPYGLVPEGALVGNALEAAEAAERVGFPVAVKVADERVVHKTDRGLVRVGLGSTVEVIAAVRAFEQELHAEAVPVIVQPVLSGTEVALGVFRDPAFGPLIMVSAGGVATDVWDDRVFLIPPVSERDAARAVRSLRLWPLLEGYRGEAPRDVAGLERLIVSLGRLAADVPQVVELDLNPVMVSPERATLVDVKVRLAQGRAVSPGIPRQLRTTR